MASSWQRRLANLANLIDLKVPQSLKVDYLNNTFLRCGSTSWASCWCSAGPTRVPRAGPVTWIESWLCLLTSYFQWSEQTPRRHRWENRDVRLLHDNLPGLTHQRVLPWMGAHPSHVCRHANPNGEDIVIVPNRRLKKSSLWTGQKCWYQQTGPAQFSQNHPPSSLSPHQAIIATFVTRP